MLGFQEGRRDGEGLLGGELLNTMDFHTCSPAAQCKCRSVPFQWPSGVTERLTLWPFSIRFMQKSWPHTRLDLRLLL